MSSDDDTGEERGSEAANESSDDQPAAEVRDRLEEGADRAAEQIDESVVDLLAWVLDTETRARIYVELRQHPDGTSEEIADGTGLYPSTVREALAELHEEGKVHRRKRENDGAGNNPYEYRAMAPTDLVRETIGDVQRELNTVFNLDSYLGGESDGESDGESEPVTINVEDESAVHDDVETSVETADEDDSDDDSADNAGDADDESDPVDATDDEE